MRTVPLVLSLLVLTGCTTEGSPDAVRVPTGPCAAERVQPPEGSQEQRAQADLDGDGRTDEVVSWLVGGERVVQAWLADGRNAEPERLFSDLLAAGPAGGAPVVLGAVPQTAGTKTEDLRAGVFVLDGCRLTRVEGPDGPLELVYGTGSDRLQATATVRCTARGVEELLSRPAPQPRTRIVQTTLHPLQDGRAGAPVVTEARVPQAQDPVEAVKGTAVCG